MNRKVQVRFLGDKGGATRLRYPTKLDANITGTLSSLESANSKLETTQDLIKKSREEIKADMKKQLGSKLLWGAGGVVVGLSVSSAIILLVSK
ncbi:MAG: hypothetical protein M0P47_11200 [Bacteroidales bacterium]|nr:hypothetical protein [Bacteroidales bacterium]